MKNRIYLVLITILLLFPFFVYAEDPVTPTPTDPSLQADSSLKSLTVSEGSLEPAFSKDVKNYKVIVKSGITNITINAEATDSSASIDESLLGNKELNVGLNNFKIKVVASDNTESEYVIEVNRATPDLKLSKLAFQGTKLNEIFSPDRTEYTCDVANAVTKVNPLVTKADGTKYVVSGNSNLKVGKNIVTITIQNDANESMEYRIVVNRASEEVVIEEDDDSDVDDTSELDTSEITTPADEISGNKKEDEGASKIRSIIIIVLSVLSFLIAVLGIIIFIRTSNNSKGKEKKINKLKKKQAKIEKQLTGLIPVADKKDTVIEKERNIENTKSIPRDDVLEEEFEKTIEIKDLKKDIQATRSSRVERRIQENYDEFDDLFDDRDL